MSDINTGFDNDARSMPLEALPFTKEGRNRIYNPSDPLIKSWLKNKWQFGYNPLAVDKTDYSTVMQLSLPDGQKYSYSEPGHSYEHYRQNKDGQPPKFLVHVTKAGWIEYALKKNEGMIGKDDKTWTGSHDPHRWWGGSFPDNFEFTQPPDRFVELMFDAEKLREAGYEGRTVPDSDYYIFDRKLPLEALVPTSKAYLSQVLDFTIPEKAKDPS